MKKYKYSAFIVTDDRELEKIISILLETEHIELTAATRVDILPPSSIVIIDFDSQALPQKSFRGLIGLSSAPENLPEETKSACRAVFSRPFSFAEFTEAVLDAFESAELGSFEDCAPKPVPTLELYEKERTAVFGIKTLLLTQSESAILALLLKKRGDIVTHSEISDAVGDGNSNKSVVFVCTLRKKLESEFGISPIRTVHKKGYMIK